MKVISREADAPTIVGRMIVCEYCKAFWRFRSRTSGRRSPLTLMPI